MDCSGPYYIARQNRGLCQVLLYEKRGWHANHLGFAGKRSRPKMFWRALARSVAHISRKPRKATETVPRATRRPAGPVGKGRERSAGHYQPHSAGGATNVAGLNGGWSAIPADGSDEPGEPLESEAAFGASLDVLLEAISRDARNVSEPQAGRCNVQPSTRAGAAGRLLAGHTQAKMNRSPESTTKIALVQHSDHVCLCTNWRSKVYLFANHCHI